jgi:hypothetical protein
VGLAGRDLALQAGGQELLVGPASARARSASRATDWRRVGALSARVRNASSAVRSRVAVVVVAAAITPPLVVVEAKGGVVVGQAPQLDLGPAGCLADHGAVAAQLGCGGQVVGVAEGLVAGPAALMVGDQPPITERLDPLKVGADSTRRPTTAGWTE